MDVLSNISIEGLKGLSDALDERMKKFKGKQHITVNVGYSAEYAIYVHEIPKNYKNGKTTKFLEIPARTERQAMIDIIIKVINSQQSSMKRAMTQAGNHLKRESQKLVPYDTGHLHDSAFVNVLD